MKKLYFLLFIFPSFFSYYGAYAQVINTYAGNGMSGDSGDGGPATAAQLGNPSGVAVDSRQNVYITDQLYNSVRKVSPAGTITLLAGGNSFGGYTGDGGPATAAQLYFPEGLAVDQSGNVYIADEFNNVIRKVDTVGIITTVAGSGALGYSGDGGPATNARLWHPIDVGVDYHGNIYAVDQNNHAVRKISAATGIIATIAGNDTAGYRGDGGPATAAELNFPQGIAVDSAGNAYVADCYNYRVRKITPAGIITTVAGGGTTEGLGGPATAASLAQVTSLSLDKEGNLYIDDFERYKIKKVYTNGIINGIAGNDTDGYRGDGGPATAAEISDIEGIAVNDSGKVFIADFGNAVVRIITDVPVNPITLGVSNNKEDVQLVLFPNPSCGQFTINVGKYCQMVNVKIYNEIGLEVYQSAFNNSPTMNISLAGQRQGIYFLYLETGANTIVKRIFINY